MQPQEGNSNLGPGGDGIRLFDLDVWRIFVFYWSFVDFVSIRELFGMAGGPRSRPLGVDSGPGGGGSEEVGGPRTLYKYVFV